MKLSLMRQSNRYGLSLHEEKTKLVDSRKHPQKVEAEGTTTFNFLGFTHVWGKSKKGNHVVRQYTAKDQYAKVGKAINEWCRMNLHRPVEERHAKLCRRIRGHYAYYGITGNMKRLHWFIRQVVRI